MKSNLIDERRSMSNRLGRTLGRPNGTSRRSAGSGGSKQRLGSISPAAVSRYWVATLTPSGLSTPSTTITMSRGPFGVVARTRTLICVTAETSPGAEPA